jgi:hypothetical protein
MAFLTLARWRFNVASYRKYRGQDARASLSEGECSE